VDARRQPGGDQGRARQLRPVIMGRSATKPTNRTPAPLRPAQPPVGGTTTAAPTRPAATAAPCGCRHCHCHCRCRCHCHCRHRCSLRMPAAAAAAAGA